MRPTNELRSSIRKIRTLRANLCTQTRQYGDGRKRRVGPTKCALAPSSLVAKIQNGYIHFQWKGDTRLLKSMLEGIPAGVDPDGSITAARWDVAMLQRDYSAAKKILETSSVSEISYSNAGMTPKIFWRVAHILPGR